jgi:nucleoside-diphosphate-sugar epimerase
MAILITGGTGLIGSFVVRSLLEMGEVPVVFDIGEPGVSLQDLSGRFPFVKGNIMDFDLLAQTIKDHGIDQIIHLAALLQFGSEGDPKKAIEINVQGTLNVLEASRRMDVRKVVFASTVAIYGSQAGLINENSPIPPDLSMYAATKLLGEVLLERYYRLYGIAYVALRFWGIYGPGETRGSGMGEVFKKIESIIFEKEVVVEEVGAEERRHFTFIKDAAQAVIKALFAKNNVHRIFNIAGGDESYSNLAEFCQIIKRLFPSAGKVIFGEKKWDDRGKADIALARMELGYCPEYSLEKGIKEDIDFFLPYREHDL